MESTICSLRPLLLAGGKSTRMGSAKHLLQMPDNRPLYQRQLEILAAVCPKSEFLYLSLARESPLDTFLQSAPTISTVQGTRKVQIIYDLETNTEGDSAGPSSGLLAAFSEEKSSTWLVLACDYPLMTIDALQRLRASYRPPVTCFKNAEGFLEPLVGIWSPPALMNLETAVRGGRTGPSSVVKQLRGATIALEKENTNVLFNANTPQDWEIALQRLQ